MNTASLHAYDTAPIRIAGAHRRPVGRRPAYVIDTLILGLVALLACIPFGDLYRFQFYGARIDLFETVYLLLLPVSCARLLLARSPGNVRPLTILVVCFLLGLLPLLTGASDSRDVLIHIRLFLPLILSTTLLAAGTSISLKRLLYVLAFSQAISAAGALYIHFLNPALMNSFAEDDAARAAEFVKGGRVFYNNDYLVLITIAAYPYIARIASKKIQIAYLISCLIGIFTDITGFGRSILVTLTLCVAGVWLYVSRGNKALTSVPLIVASLAITGGLVYVAGFDPRVSQAYSTRIVGVVDSGTDLERQEDVLDRIPLYRDYWQRMLDSFPLGQGLGQPVSNVDPAGPVLFTDVSIVAFVVPFGVLGLVLGSVLLGAIIKASRAMKFGVDAILKRGVLVLIVCSVLASLNEDIFSRRTFVIYLGLLTAAIINHTRNNRRIGPRMAAVADQPREIPASPSGFSHARNLAN